MKASTGEFGGGVVLLAGCSLSTVGGCRLMAEGQVSMGCAVIGLMCLLIIILNAVLACYEACSWAEEAKPTISETQTEGSEA